MTSRRKLAIDALTKAGVRASARGHRTPLAERLSTESAPLAGAVAAALLANPASDPTTREVIDKIEAVRASYIASDEEVAQIDFGAGEGTAGEISVATDRTRRVSDFVQEVSKSPRLGALLYSLVYEVKPKRILEFGTAFGLSGAYMLAALDALGEGTLTTMEGAPGVADVARRTWETVGLPLPEVVLGNFDVTLPQLLHNHDAAHPFDMVFIDGNHRAVPTVSYFHQLLPHLSDPCVVVFDDITWTADMRSAWRMVQRHPDTVLSVDIASMGLLVVGASHGSPSRTYRGTLS